MNAATRILLYSTTLLTLGAGAVSGQGHAATGTWGFVNVRYDTRSPASIYTGYGWHARVCHWAACCTTRGRATPSWWEVWAW